MTDTIIIGGGAAGLCLAVILKQQTPDCSVKVLEAQNRVGKKLATTGNGRCNISNKKLEIKNYHGDRELAYKLIEGFDFSKQADFFRSIGVIFSDVGDDRVYPMSLQAASVTDALRFAAMEQGVEIITDFKVSSIKRENGMFLVNGDPNLLAKTVVVACGGKAGGKLGSSDGYNLLKSLGHKIVPLFPSIAQLKTDVTFIKRLRGIKLEATVTLTSSMGSRTESGELLFCEYGISGPPVLQVSRFANGNEPFVLLDLVPMFDETEITNEIKSRRKLFPKRSVEELFTGFINKKVGQAVLLWVGVPATGLCGELSDRQISDTVKLLKNLKLKVISTTGFENAQVTAGGADTSQFFCNLMSKKAKGLFAVGEVLNIDGDCGGYNLAFAWASAYAAAKGIADYLNNKE